MKRAIALGAVLLATALGGVRASAQTATPAPAEPRPSEADIFGAPAKEPEKTPEKSPEKSPEKAPETPAEKPPEAETKPTDDKPAPPPDLATPAEPAVPPGAENARDADLLGDPEGATRLSEEVAPDDPLKIGGMFYLRMLTSARQDQAVKNWSLSAPALLDAYLDARPNDRVRGLVLGRMSFDSTAPASVPTSNGNGMTGMGGVSDTMGTADLSSLFAQRTRGPHMVLDQMWLRFDLARTVFVTAGKQHVRWGTGRFWAPTDYLHVRKRNPLDLFDARTGTTMLKLHLPWEETGWNFYAYALLEGAESTPLLGDLAGAARAEIVLGDAELGLGALLRRGEKPKLGADLSTGIWDFDVYGEVALRYGSEIDRVRYDENAPTTFLPGERAVDVIERVFPTTHRSGVKVQAVGGLTYERKYNDNDTFTLGAEYFSNPLGYESPRHYPGLVLPRATPLREPATFFYLGRHYGVLFLLLPAPYEWNYTTFTLSTLGNLSDQSFTTRLDYSLTLLTHLRFEAFLGVRYGRHEGEFRFGVDGLEVGDQVFRIPPGLVDLGLGLRVDM